MTRVETPLSIHFNHKLKKFIKYFYVEKFKKNYFNFSSKLVLKSVPAKRSCYFNLLLGGTLTS